MKSHEGLVLVGDVFAVIHVERLRAANLVCENDRSRLRWYLDTATRHPLMGVVEQPAGFSENEFFTHYEAFRHGGVHTWVRERRPLVAETIIEILVDLLQETARP